MIKNSDLTQINEYGQNALMIALEDKVKFKKEQWKYIINNSDISLITDKEQLITLKKIISEFLNEEILSKIDIKKETKKINKV